MKWTHWLAHLSDAWVSQVIKEGYEIPFVRSPPLTKANVPAGTQERPGEEADHSGRSRTPGFYSRIFLVPKVTGGWKPVIDLSHLNSFVTQNPFGMETPASVLQSIREGDCMVSLDLKVVYF